jgi:large subunit ribosomal protein L2
MSSLQYKKPTTPSQRHQCLLKNSYLDKIKILKNQSCFLKNKAGRNNEGQITIYTKGGGHKKKYRKILHKRGFLFGVVEAIEYDPYRSANIARVFSEVANLHFYILAPEGLKKGHLIKSQIEKKEDLRFKIGDFFYLKDLPLGVFVHNISFMRKGGVARSAGCSAQIISKSDRYCRLRLSSGEHRLFFLYATATLGTLSNPLHKRVVLGKAGRSR